jgi:hypothetical protein
VRPQAVLVSAKPLVPAMPVWNVIGPLDTAWGGRLNESGPQKVRLLSMMPAAFAGGSPSKRAVPEPWSGAAVVLM